MRLQEHPAPGTLVDFDKRCINILNEILIAEPTLEIVVSSDWQRWVPLPLMQEFYLKQGIIRAPIGYSGWKKSRYEEIALKRSECILEFVDLFAPWAWIAVDDLPLKLTSFVKTDPKEGILFKKDAILNALSYQST